LPDTFTKSLLVLYPKPRIGIETEEVFRFTLLNKPFIQTVLSFRFSVFQSDLRAATEREIVVC